MEKRLIYFDNAASTPMSEGVIAAVYESMRAVYGNPSSVHEQGRRARVLVEQARRSIAKLLRVSPGEIIFTSGGTEANNAILRGCCLDLGYRHFITSRLEHPAVLKCLEALQDSGDAEVHYVDLESNGHIKLEHLAELLAQYFGSLVSLMHANNETGNLLPVNAVSALCRKHKALFHSDTVQTIGKFDVDFSALGMDFAAASAHKFHGPKGVGFMFVRSGHFFEPFIKGGGQERNMRAGTENIHGIVGMAKALEEAHESMTEDMKHIKSLKTDCMHLLKQHIPGIGFHGDAEGSSLHTILNIFLPEGIDAEMLLPALDIEGICVSAGSACASGVSKGSHVLAAMGADGNRPSLRVSFSRYNTPDEVTKLVDVLKRVVC